jgi:nucleoside-diphosphate-sugar epimerase
VIGTGYVGARVLDALGPDAAVGFGRTPPAASACRFYPLDLDREPVAVPVAMPGRILYTVPPAADNDGDLRLARLLARLTAAPERFVYLSTSGVYGDCVGERVSESRQPAPLSPRAKRRLAAERLLQAWCRKSGTCCIIFRVPGIYGPGRLGIERIAAGGTFIEESDAFPGNRIHADDLASAAIAALNRNIPDGVYNIGDGDFRSATRFALTVARLAGLSPPQLVSRAEAEQTMPASRLSFLRESRRLDTRKMREVLGVKVKYADAEDGIRESLRDEGRLAD